MTDSVMITGASGFIGSRLAFALEAAGLPVARCARSRDVSVRDWRPYDLVWEALPTDFFQGVSTVVHTAFVPSAARLDSFTINLRAATILTQAADRANVNVVFISSLAAHDEARSTYGHQKLAIERLMRPRDLIVRPGLVIGAGGIFERLVAHLRSGKPVPLIDRGRQPLQTVYIDDLVASLLVLLRTRTAGTIVLAESPAVTYRDFFGALCARLGRRGHQRDDLPRIRPYTAGIEAFLRSDVSRNLTDIASNSRVRER
jgi:nucleoside-diphosphate-sugar epimerase